MEKFERYCNPRKNLTFDRHSFFTRNQQEGETIDTYVTELRNKAYRCEFADLKDGLIRDRIVCGITNDSVRARLLRESDLSLEKCVDICRASEISAFQLKELTDENYCGGYRHRRGRCPAYGKNCNRCKKLHHFASMYKAKEANFIDKTDEEQDQHYFIGTVNSDEAKQDDWCVHLKVNEHTTSFKIDTGAQWHEIKAVGKATIAVECKDKYYLLDVQVVNSDVIPVLRLPSSNELNLIQRVHNIESSNDQSTEEILEKYEYLFEGIGTPPGEYEIKIEEPVSPTIHPPRRIPHMLKDKVKDELNRMEARGIITKVEQPTKWVNPMVVLKKPNDDVRICLDPVDLNKVIQREHYPLKTVEEVAASLGNANIFSTFDATSGFYQIKLTEESTVSLGRVTDSTSNTVVNVLQQHLARYGLPEILYTDNGPEFSSKEFFNFVRKYQFQHVTSSPTFPQSNGFVERTIQTAKKLLKKACDDGSDPHLAILELRNTPIQGVDLSPMQLLMGRRAKTLIPIKQSLLKPMAYDVERVQQ
ncbi:retrotransposon-like family member retr-1 [Paramuricea clavata]|uniref:Retrotransposon-like family member retr-1 n=1 Tax=Paramuricea clavata TaxID=317549 RepID=A0A7D9DEK4_PARCT|nr:retrotransposon-like family member retr-1 [Paramuricea clavata]